MAIIGLLASIVTVSLSSSRAKGRDAKRVADIKNIELALRLYYTDNGMYPLNIYGTGSSAPTMGLAPNYLPKVPTDPSSTVACTGSQASCYKYSAYRSGASAACSATNRPLTYHLGAVMEDTSSRSLSEDIDAATSAYTGYTVCTGTGVSAYDGNATNCSGTSAASPDPCYDMKP